MASKKEKQIIQKIKVLITQNFEDPETAFSYFDKDGDGKLQRSEVEKLLKDASVSGFIRSIVATKLIEKFDDSKDENIAWDEFKDAVKDIV